MWEVIGYECVKNVAGEITSYSVYCQKPFDAENGGIGVKTCKEYYKSASVKYRPQIGDRVVFVKEQYGQYLVITDVIVMN